MMYLKKRLKAIGYAFYGIIQAFQQEAHLKLQALIALAVICVGFYCHLNAFEWFMVTTVITLVICLEMLNSAIEKLCDQVTLERNPKIKYIKDVAAGAVLLACFLAFVVGCIVFIPHFLS